MQLAACSYRMIIVAAFFLTSSLSIIVVRSATLIDDHHPTPKQTEFLSRIYANYYEHCDGSPSYFIEKNQRFAIHGSVPAVEPLTPAVRPLAKNGTDFSGDESNDSNATAWTSYFYLSPVCLFTLTGPRNQLLSLQFEDANCQRWPSGCSITVWDGNYKTDPKNSPPILSFPMFVNNAENSSSLGNGSLDVPRNNAAFCSFVGVSRSNVMTFRIDSCLPMASSEFNFTTIITPFETRRALSLQPMTTLLSQFSRAASTSDSNSGANGPSHLFIFGLCVIVAGLLVVLCVALRLFTRPKRHHLSTRLCCCVCFKKLMNDNYVAPTPTAQHYGGTGNDTSRTTCTLTVISARPTDTPTKPEKLNKICPQLSVPASIQSDDDVFESEPSNYYDSRNCRA